LKKQLQDTEERLHGTHQHTSGVGEVIGHAVQADNSGMVFRTPSKHNPSPHWNSGTVGFIPFRSAALMSQQDSENKLEIALLEREEGEVIQLETNSFVLDPLRAIQYGPGHFISPHTQIYKDPFTFTGRELHYRGGMCAWTSWLSVAFCQY
jgi:hypothetical protein